MEAKRKPTISELEKMLEDKSVHVEIRPSGEVISVPLPCPRCSRLTVEGLAKVVGEAISKPGAFKDMDNQIAQAVLDYIRKEG